MRKNGYVTGCSAGDTVPYVICFEQVPFTPSSYHSSSKIVPQIVYPYDFSIEFISAMSMFSNWWQGEGLSVSTGISQRARHPDELKNGNGKWMIDIDYYLAQQVCLMDYWPWTSDCSWLCTLTFSSLSALLKTMFCLTDTSCDITSLCTNSGN